MKKMPILFLGLGLALALAGTWFAPYLPALGQAQTICPVMGGKANPNIYADCQGQRLYFCCPACPELFQKDPEKYMKKLKEQQTAPNPGAVGK